MSDKTVLYIEDDDDIREIFMFKMKLTMDLNIIDMDGGRPGIEYLKNNPDNVDCIVSDLEMINGDGISVYQYMRDNNVNIPFILMTGDSRRFLDKFPDFKEHNPTNRIIEKPPEDDELEDSLAFLSAPAPQDAEQELIPVRLHLLRSLKKANTDIFIKLSDEKFVQIFEDHAELTDEDIDKYSSKGVTNAYIKKENVTKFWDKLMEDFLIKHPISSSSTAPDALEYELDAHQIVHQKLINSGFNEKSLLLAQETVDQVVDVLNSKPELGKKLKSLANKNDWLYEHSLMNSVLCTMMLKTLKIDTKENLHKLCLASFFHDICFTNGEQAKELELHFFEMDGNTIKEKNSQYFHHPLKGLEMIEKFKDIPQDVITIIQQSHETPDGKGFPKGLTAKDTHALASIFNTSHTFLNHLYASSFEENDMKSAIEKMSKVFNSGHYEKGLKAIKDDIKS